MNTVLVTGGCGFIGSNFLNLYVPRLPDWTFINVDKLTYAGNPHNVTEIDAAPNYHFIRADIGNETGLNELFTRFNPNWIVHFAAESHVDRSIHGPRDFLTTNVMGTFNLLQACRAHWSSFADRLFHHVSTDEVYGSLDSDGAFTEKTAYNPSSPYSASKASSDHLVRAYHRTYGLPVKLTNCSNNYGPFQFPEKLIPLMTLNAFEGKPLPVYGKGENIRDWLFVEDHCEAIMAVAQRGRLGETYNIGGNCERQNLEVVHAICDAVAQQTGRSASELRELVTFVTDRPGHDFRYAMDTTKIETELGWQPRETFESGLAKTVRWYLDHSDWVEQVRTGDYRKWIKTNYGERTAQ